MSGVGGGDGRAHDVSEMLSKNQWCGRSVNLLGVGPGGEAGDDVELAEEATDDLIGVGGGAEAVDLGHHLSKRLLHVLDRALRVVLALLFKTALTACELFAIEAGQGMESCASGRAAIGQ